MPHVRRQFKSKVDKCAEEAHGNPNRKCSVRIPKQSIIYCGENLRDEIMGDRLGTREKVCDCIVYMENGEKVSLVEMKSRVKKDYVGQFNGGLKILKHILTADTFSLQAILATRSPPSQHSEYNMLKKTLTGVNRRVGIKRIECGESLPECYIPRCSMV